MASADLRVVQDDVAVGVAAQHDTFWKRDDRPVGEDQVGVPTLGPLYRRAGGLAARPGS